MRSGKLCNFIFVEKFLLPFQVFYSRLWSSELNFGRSMIHTLRLCVFQLLSKLAKIWHFYRSENYVVTVQKSFTAISPDRPICIQYTSYSPNNCCFAKILQTSHLHRASQCPIYWVWKRCSEISNTSRWIKHGGESRCCLCSWISPFRQCSQCSPFRQCSQKLQKDSEV